VKTRALGHIDILEYRQLSTMMCATVVGDNTKDGAPVCNNTFWRLTWCLKTRNNVLGSVYNTCAGPCRHPRMPLRPISVWDHTVWAVVGDNTPGV